MKHIITSKMTKDLKTNKKYKVKLMITPTWIPSLKISTLKTYKLKLIMIHNETRFMGNG